MKSPISFPFFPIPPENSCALQALGAEVQRLRPVSITHPDHFVNVARRRAAQQAGAAFADQFENPANFRAHLRTGELLHSGWGGVVVACVMLWVLCTGRA